MVLWRKVPGFPRSARFATRGAAMNPLGIAHQLLLGLGEQRICHVEQSVIGWSHSSSTYTKLGSRVVERLVVVETVGTGHRLEYVSQVVQAAQDAGLAVTLVTTHDVAQTAQFGLQLGQFRPAVLDTETIAGPFVRAKTARLACQNCRSTIVFLEADRHLALVLALSFVKFFARSRRPVVALLMRPPIPDRTRPHGRTKQLLWRLASRAPKVRVCALADCFGALGPGVDRRWTAVTDVPTRYAAEIRGGPPQLEPPILLLAGMIDARKAPIQVAAAALQGSTCDVRIVGSVDAETARGLTGLGAEYGARLRVDNRYLSNAELDLVIQESTIVSVVLTSPSGPSGMLARACLYGKPVLAGGNNRTVIEAVRSRQLGSVARGLSTGQVAAAISDIQANHALYVENVERAEAEISGHPTLGGAIVAIALGAKFRQ